MSSTEAVREAYLRSVPVSIPTNWCVSCTMTLRTEEEYVAHIAMFPLHNIRKITSLVCPTCGKEVDLENGRFSRHGTGYSQAKTCPGSGKEA